MTRPKPPKGDLTEKVPSTWRIEVHPLEWFRPNPDNPRKYSPEAIAQFASAMRRFGFNVPVLCKTDGSMVDGHFRLATAPVAGLTEIPCIPRDDWTDVVSPDFLSPGKPSPSGFDLAQLVADMGLVEGSREAGVG